MLDQDMRNENLGRAERLIADAERLARSTDWKEAGDAIKGLQQAWKGVHPLPKGDSDTLWQRFNGACQAFHEARSEAFERSKGGPIHSFSEERECWCMAKRYWALPVAAGC